MATANASDTQLVATPVIDVVLQLSNAQKADLRASFNLFDERGEGSIDAKDVRVVLRALGYDPSTEEVAELTGAHEVGGRLDFASFLAVLGDRICKPDSHEEQIKAFRLFDRDSKGRIDVDDLRRVGQEVQETLNDEELQEMIDSWDRNGDGVIDEDEFTTMTRQVHLRTPTSNSRPRTHREYELERKESSEDDII